MPQKIFDFLIKVFNTLKERASHFKKSAKKARMSDVEKKILLKVSKKRQIPYLAQFKYLPRFLSKREKHFFFIFLGLFLVSILGIFTLLYFDNTKLGASRGGEYVEGIVGYSRFINPLYSQTNDVDKDLSFLIYSGLTKRNVRGEVVLDLAKEYTLSEDEKIYTFVLRDDVIWHDEKVFTADDVIFTINAIQNEEYNSSLRASWQNVTVEKIDDTTVQFKLKNPYGYFLDLLTVGILPKHIWERVPIANINLAEANNKPVGTGPYKFKSFTKDKVGVIKAYEFEVNEKYYNEKPNIEIISVKFYPDYISAVNALDNQQIDGLSFVPSEARSALKLKSRLEGYNLSLPQFNALFLNQNKNTILRDKDVRQALAIAIDRKKIIKDALEGDAKIIDGPISQGYFGYDDGIATTEHSKEKAESILVESGWVLRDGNPYRTKGNAELKLTITTIEKGQNVKAAGIIKESWDAIGVEVDIKIVSISNIFNEVISNRDYEVLLFGETYGPNLDIYPYWHSAERKHPGLNLAMYSNREVDAILEEARKTSDEVVRKNKFQEFQHLLIEDFPLIFLWQPQYTYFVDKKVKGFSPNLLLAPQDRFIHLFDAFIKTKRTIK